MRPLSTALIAVLLLAACGDKDEDGEGDESAAVGDPSGAACPTEDPPTYANFGQEFMGKYCTRCHASDVPTSARNGAPSDHNFDTLGGIQAAIDHIDQEAAEGPDSTNVAMPPSGPAPSSDERTRLGQWLACGAN